MFDDHGYERHSDDDNIEHIETIATEDTRMKE